MLAKDGCANLAMDLSPAHWFFNQLLFINVFAACSWWIPAMKQAASCKPILLQLYVYGNSLNFTIYLRKFFPTQEHRADQGARLQTRLFNEKVWTCRHANRYLISINIRTEAGWMPTLWSVANVFGSVRCLQPAARGKPADDQLDAGITDNTRFFTNQY